MKHRRILKAQLANAQTQIAKTKIQRLIRGSLVIKTTNPGLDRFLGRFNFNKAFID